MSNKLIYLPLNLIKKYTKKGLSDVDIQLKSGQNVCFVVHLFL